MVTALVAFVPVSGLVAERASAEPQRAAADGGIRAADIIGGSDVEKALERMEGIARADGGELPAYFGEEIGLVEGARDVRVDAAGRIVGYTVDAPVEEAFGRVRERMARAGWSEVSLGGAEGSTFVKGDGKCAWTLVTCTQVGNATGVVFRSVVR